MSIKLSDGIPENKVYIEGKFLCRTCDSISIKYEKVIVGWSKYKGMYSPIFDGVCIDKEDEQKLLDAIERKKKRQLTDEQKIEQRTKKQKKDEEDFVTAIKEMYPSIPNEDASNVACISCKIGSGRVGRTNTLSMGEKVERAVRAYIRHSYTNYDSLYADGEYADFGEREFNKNFVRDQVNEIENKWKEK